MQKINIKASHEYDVFIEKDLLMRSGNLIAELVNKACTVVVISDDNVFSLYGNTLMDSLKLTGFVVLSMTFLAGERSKSLKIYEEILSFLAQNKINRGDILIALGGGVTGDLVGFVAATYLRGVRYIQIPTTLLAAVDSSVGGKTAINLNHGKNLVGSFYQPLMVICDPNVFSTLTPETYSDGCAEIIKYGFIGDPDFVTSLQNVQVKEQFEKVIAVCVAMKRDIVCLDEFDIGKRQLLNFGHTFGHAIEKCSDFRISHGKAVAIGMSIVSRAAVKLGMCQQEVLNRLLLLLKAYDLPTETKFSADDLYAAALSDKKVNNGLINLIVPCKIGECIIRKISAKSLKDWLYAGGLT